MNGAADREPGASDGGFLAVDALVGLTIVTMGLVFVIELSGQSLRLLDRANDLRAESAMAAACLQAPSGGPRLAESGALSVEHHETAGPEGGLCWVECRTTAKRSTAVVRLRTQRLCSAPPA
jgi:hypothetical protein